jgi:hypothetical protein
VHCDRLFELRGLDKADLHAQERWSATLAREVDAALADPTCVWETTDA